MAPKNKSLQEDKEETIRDQRQAKQIAEFKNLIKQTMKKKDIYYRDDLTFLRDFVDYIEDHQVEYPRTLAVQSGAPGSAYATHTTPMLVTKGYVQSLASHSFSNDGMRPIAQVLDIETSYKDGAPGHERVKKTVASIIDGDGKRLCCHFATQITEAARSLTSGAFVRLDLFSATNHRVNPTSPLMPVILVLRYTALGHSDLIVSRSEITTPETEPFSSATDENDPPPVSSPDTSESEDIEAIPNRKAVCTWDHRLCSVYGIEAKVCVCVTNPVDRYDLEVLAENCYFVYRPVNEMKPWHKRNLLYWWYATNVYQICGKFKRGRLPVCLVRMIRMAHPNPSGVPYKDFVELEEDEMATKRRRCSRDH